MIMPLFKMSACILANCATFGFRGALVWPPVRPIPFFPSSGGYAQRTISRRAGIETDGRLILIPVECYESPVLL